MTDFVDGDAEQPSPAPTLEDQMATRLLGLMAAVELLIQDHVAPGKEGMDYLRNLRTRARARAAQQWAGERRYATDSTEIVFEDFLFPVQRAMTAKPSVR